MTTRHFDNEIYFASSEGLDGMRVDIVKPQKFFPSTPFGLSSLPERAR